MLVNQPSSTDYNVKRKTEVIDSAVANDKCEVVLPVNTNQEEMPLFPILLELLAIAVSVGDALVVRNSF